MSKRWHRCVLHTCILFLSFIFIIHFYHSFYHSLHNFNNTIFSQTVLVLGIKGTVSREFLTLIIFYQSIIYCWVEMIVWGGGERKGMNQKQYTTTTTVNHLYLPLSFIVLPSSLSFSFLILVSAIINILYYLHK